MKKLLLITSIFILASLAFGASHSFVIKAISGETNLDVVGAAIWFDDGSGPVQVSVTDLAGSETFLSPGNYRPGRYWVESEDFCQWVPEYVDMLEDPLTRNYLSTFVGYTVCDEPVPVVLSSFTAGLTAQNNVQISWITQSETQMMGYRIYRNTVADQSGAMLIDHPMVHATNTSETQIYNVVDSDVLTDQTYYYWLEAVEYNVSNFYGPVGITVSGAGDTPGYPEITTLKNAYPNPFKADGSTNIEVDLKAGETGTLTIYNVMGQIVKIENLSQGNHTIIWNGRDSKGTAVGSGIYFYKLSTPSLNQTKKMVIVK